MLIAAPDAIQTDVEAHRMRFGPHHILMVLTICRSTGSIDVLVGFLVCFAICSRRRHLCSRLSPASNLILRNINIYLANSICLISLNRTLLLMPQDEQFAHHSRHNWRYSCSTARAYAPGSPITDEAKIPRSCRRSTASDCRSLAF